MRTGAAIIAAVIAHAPPQYDCPFCKLAAGGETTRSTQSDVVHRDATTTAFVAAKWWDGNAGHVLVVPNQHFENVYSIADDVLASVYAAAKRVAIAIRETYGCDGTSMRQHNEPAGDQDVWHFHVHVFPRYDGDDLYLNHRRIRWPAASERAPYAERLRSRLASPIAR